VELRGLDPLLRGRFRIASALHLLDTRGYRTRLELAEEGLDLAAPASEDVGARS
jgi:hypothetical protein